MVINKKVLVVDDDPSIKDVITLVLDMEGFQVIGLDNGLDVLSEIKSNRPDVILLDVRLRDCDGRDICKMIKQSPKTRSIPVIIISASHGEYTKHEKNCGADDYIAKPFDIDYLLERVKHYAFHQ